MSDSKALPSGKSSGKINCLLRNVESVSILLNKNSQPDPLRETASWMSINPTAQQLQFKNPKVKLKEVNASLFRSCTENPEDTTNLEARYIHHRLLTAHTTPSFPTPCEDLIPTPGVPLFKISREGQREALWGRAHIAPLVQLPSPMASTAPTQCSVHTHTHTRKL